VRGRAKSQENIFKTNKSHYVSGFPFSSVQFADVLHVDVPKKNKSNWRWQGGGRRKSAI